MVNFTRYWAEIQLKKGDTVYGRKWPEREKAEEELVALREKTIASGRAIRAFGVMQDDE